MKLCIVIKLTMQIRYRRILTIKSLISRNVFLHGCRSSKPSSLLLWSPYVIGQTIIFLACDFYLSFFFLFFSSPNLSGRRLDVYHTSTHGVALVRI